MRQTIAASSRTSFHFNLRIESGRKRCVVYWLWVVLLFCRHFEPNSRLTCKRLARLASSRRRIAKTWTKNHADLPFSKQLALTSIQAMTQTNTQSAANPDCKPCAVAVVHLLGQSEWLACLPVSEKGVAARSLAGVRKRSRCPLVRLTGETTTSDTRLVLAH